MSAETLADLRPQVVEATLEVIWSQWYATGASAAARRAATSVVDPEALILMSLALTADEPRLSDLLNDWLKLNSRSVSVQRMGNLAAGFPDGTREALRALASRTVIRAKDARWKSLAAGAAPAVDSRTNKIRAVEHSFDVPAALLLKLRLGLGVGVKADVVTFLLSTGGAWASVPVIAAATGYAPAGIRRVVDDLSDAHFIAALSGLEALLEDGAQTVYVAPHEDWRALLRVTGSFPRWRSWAERFQFVAALLDWLAMLSERSISEYATSVEARRLIETHQAAFVRDRAVMLPDAGSEGDWAAYLRDVTLQLTAWMLEYV